MSFIFERCSENRLQSQKDNEEASQIYNFKSSRIGNAKKQSQIQCRCFIFQSLLCFANIICLICVGFLLSDDSQLQLIYDVCTLFSFLSSIFHVFKTINQQKLYKNVYADAYTFHIEKLVWKIILGFYYLIHPSSITSNIQVYINQLNFNLNSLLKMVVFLRIVSIFHFFIISSRFYGGRVARVLSIYAVKEKLSQNYAIRCYFKVKGLKMPLFILIGVLCLIPLIRMAFYDALGLHGSFLGELYDTVITMTTVGYGQILRSSNLMVRIGIVIIILTGSFISSLLTLTIINYFQLNHHQHKAFIIYSALNRLRVQEQIQKQHRRNLQTFINNNKQNAFPNNQIRKNKALLKQYNFRQSFAQYYNSQFNSLQRDIKKIVQKQQVIDNLMRFYFERTKNVQRVTVKQQPHIKRTKDSLQYGNLFDLILDVDQ